MRRKSCQICLRAPPIEPRAERLLPIGEEPNAIVGRVDDQRPPLEEAVDGVARIGRHAQEPEERAHFWRNYASPFEHQLDNPRVGMTHLQPNRLRRGSWRHLRPATSRQETNQRQKRRLHNPIDARLGFGVLLESRVRSFDRPLQIS